MLLGHFAAAFVANRAEPKLSLGTLTLASMLSDFLLYIFTISGVEHIQFKPGRGAADYIAAFDAGVSHSLLAGAIWAALFAAAYFWRRRYSRGACVLFLVVMSHWLLDLISHRPDLPLAPGMDGHVGLGLWSSIPATVIVEGGFWLLAIVLYLRATRPKNRLGGVYVFWAGIGLLTLAWYNNVAGPPPPDARTAAISGFAFFSLTVAWAYWINRLRPAQPDPYRGVYSGD